MHMLLVFDCIFGSQLTIKSIQLSATADTANDDSISQRIQLSTTLNGDNTSQRLFFFIFAMLSLLVKSLATKRFSPTLLLENKFLTRFYSCFHFPVYSY